MKIIDTLSYSWEKRLKNYFSFEYRRDEFGIHRTSQGSVVTLYGKMVMEIYARGSRGDAGKQTQVSFYFLISDGRSQISNPNTGSSIDYGNIRGTLLQKAAGDGLVFIMAEVCIPLEKICLCLGGSSFDVEVSIKVGDFSLDLRLTFFVVGLDDGSFVSCITFVGMTFSV